MLFWEALQTLLAGSRDVAVRGGCNGNGIPRRLPYDTRCAAITKSGKRCKGKIREAKEYCCFHDPVLTDHRKRRIAAIGGHRHNRMARLPDGYLRKLTSVRAVGQAMDRLYREVRLGAVTPEMGAVLFGILTRMLDSGLCAGPAATSRTKASRIRPRLNDLLTRSEKAAWRKAIADAPAVYLHTDAGKQAVTVGSDRRVVAESHSARTLTVAS